MKPIFTSCVKRASAILHFMAKLLAFLYVKRAKHHSISYMNKDRSWSTIFCLIVYSASSVQLVESRDTVLKMIRISWLKIPDLSIKVEQEIKFYLNFLNLFITFEIFQHALEMEIFSCRKK